MRGNSLRLVEIVDSLVDPAVGIINVLEEVRKQAGAPNFFHYKARSCDTSAFIRERNFRECGGASAQRDVAMAKAIGEAVERYCSAIFEVEELPLADYETAPFVCVPPEQFASHLPDQYRQPGFPWVPFNRETAVRWAPCREIATGQTVHVPACRIYMPYTYYLGTGDTPIGQPISTGLACHENFARATINAICEVVERDAVMIAWQSMMAPPQIRIETLSEANYDLVQRFECTKASITVFDLTLDHGIPTILSVMRGTTSDAPALVVAGAASLDPEEAVRKSLEELAHTRRYSQYIKGRAPRIIPDPPDYDTVIDQISHLNFYVDHLHLHHAEFLFGSRKRVEFDAIAKLSSGDPTRDVEILTERVGVVGERVLVADLTTSDIDAVGLKVVRAIVPGFQPLQMGYRLRSLGGRRLYEVPRRLGYRGISEGQSDNPAPHPYP
jgi:ribosomal protein S12 methylthiotransferase accessory factor